MPLPIVAAAVGGAAANAAGGLAGSALQNFFNRRMQERAFDFSREVMQNAVRYRVEDLKAAGINPIMAASTGLGGLTAPVSAIGPGVSNPLSSLGTNAANILETLQRTGRGGKGSIGASLKQKAYHEAYETQMRAAALEQDVRVKRQQERQLEIQNILSSSDIPRATAIRDLDATEFGKRLNQIKRATGIGGLKQVVPMRRLTK